MASVAGCKSYRRRDAAFFVLNYTLIMYMPFRIAFCLNIFPILVSILYFFR